MTDEQGQVHSLKIGVIGFVTPQITTWDKAALAGKVTTEDIVDAARKYVPELRVQGADIVVALCHSGLSVEPRQGLEENAAWYLTEVPGIDAVVTGHQHKVFPGPDFVGLPAADFGEGDDPRHTRGHAGFLGQPSRRHRPNPFIRGWQMVGRR